MVKRGLLPYYKLGGLVRFKREDIEVYLKQARVEKKN